MRQPQRDGQTILNTHIDAIHAILAQHANAAGQKNIDALMAHYAADVHSFEIAPQLQLRGRDAVRTNCEAGYADVDDNFEYELRDVEITASEDVAFCHGIECIRGTRGGESFELIVRATYCFEKHDGAWKITHQHLSVPMQFSA